MHDTSREISEKMCEMMRMKLPIERVRMGCSMYETSRYLVLRAILESNPNISKIELRRELFLRFYGNDFTPETQEKIIAHLDRYSPL